ncbi:sodium-dependent transporter [Eilatimonas milleporae]|uniref:NSS family neurotransmitter:Na+ symporter n=1 Tax=Eilatimonas milleporae TaxID=911205 RepID=A0A3M0CMY9_9PROT|nr:sodium-dependent transporter [Eilatimonas milleporae]RMB04613.1 NSS family neurotransmitter:Na+ symporter [Eilatimonas milleporae]
MSQRPDRFSSRLAFVLVTAGAAVGLGNVWGFPYIAGKNGGAGFVFVYLLALGFVAAPIFMAELLLGRAGRGSPPMALARLQAHLGTGGPRWAIVGWVGIAATVLILSYYSVIAGQALAYALAAVGGAFSGWAPDRVVAYEAAFKADVGRMALWTGLFTGLSVVIIAADIRAGLERTAKVLMPLLFVLLAVLAVYAGTVGDFSAAVDFLFGVRTADWTAHMLFEAVGQAFFTVSVGIGGIMIFGAYMGDEVRLPNATLWIVLMDLAVAILAGLAIFPLVFAAPDIDPAAGPGLVYITLPTLFARLPMGSAVAALFFVLLGVAALTSAIALMAPGVARLQEAGLKRPTGAVLLGLTVFGLSFLTMLSFAGWRTVYPLAGLGFDGMTFFDLIREGVNNFVLPFGGLSFALIVGWAMPALRVRQSLPMAEGWRFRVWYGTLRYLVPVVTGLLFLAALVP